MKPSFRQAMTALHTWGGLVLGWVLCVVFVTGTLSVFASPISVWMEDIRKPPKAATASREAAARTGLAVLAERAPGAEHWFINFPKPGEALRVEWETPDHAYQAILIDPVSGREIRIAPNRETNGGYSFVSMHYDLHGGLAGLYLVGLATIVMLAALISGVVIHKRIFKDFFTLRVLKGQRSWLDGHNVASVLTLPFQIMIAFTGLAIFHYAYMPAGIATHFGMPGGVAKSFEFNGPYFQQLYPLIEDHPKRTGAAPMADIGPIIAKAEAQFGRPITRIAIDLPGDVVSRVNLFANPTDRTARRAIPYAPEDQAAFDAVSGQALPGPAPPPMNGAVATLSVMSALHQLGFGPYSVRYFYFVCGLAGAAMCATGVVLFSVKRRQRSGMEFGGATPGVYRAIEALNVVCFAGVILACISFLWINRLLPIEMESRAMIEERLKMLVWAATAVHAFLRPARAAWREQLALAGALCLALPFLNLATTGDALPMQIARGDWNHVGVETGAVIIGALLIAAAVHLSRKPRGRPAKEAEA